MRKQNNPKHLRPFVSEIKSGDLIIREVFLAADKFETLLRNGHWEFCILLHPRISSERKTIDETIRILACNLEEAIALVERELSSLGLEWDKTACQNPDNRTGEIPLYKKRAKWGKLWWTFYRKMI